MSRIAIIGSCITRDLWPVVDEAPRDLLYISRTSLPSLFSPPVDVETRADPPPDLRRHQHNAVLADLRKTALPALIAHRPTHVIFDFIDERFDLLSLGGALATHSWELETTGYLASGGPRQARAIPRLSQACERLWVDSVTEMASLLASTPLREATIILHAAQWADRYRTSDGEIRPLAEDTVIWEGRPAKRSEHNALLDRYQSYFLAAVPRAHVVAAADHHLADEGHRWGLSPFHYIPDYYREIWRQLRAIGV